MEFKPVIIETKRLILKGFNPQDMTFVFGNYSKDDIMKLLGHRNEEDFVTEQKKQQNGYASYNRSFVLFLLTDKMSGKVIGRCGLHNWNKEHKRAEIGYNMIDEDFKQKGLMSEAVNAIIEYGFDQLNLHRIEALVGSNNVPSLKIMEKEGFIKEGLLRQHYYLDGKYEDSLVFSKLLDEYVFQK